MVKASKKYSAEKFVVFTGPSKEAKFILGSPDMNWQVKGNTVGRGEGRTSATPNFSSLDSCVF